MQEQALFAQGVAEAMPPQEDPAIVEQAIFLSGQAMNYADDLGWLA